MDVKSFMQLLILGIQLLFNKMQVRASLCDSVFQPVHCGYLLIPSCLCVACGYVILAECW